MKTVKAPHARSTSDGERVCNIDFNMGVTNSEQSKAQNWIIVTTAIKINSGDTNRSGQGGLDCCREQIEAIAPN